MPPRRRLRRIASALAAGGAAAATPSASPEPPASPWAPAGHWQQLAPPRVLSEAQRRSYFEHGYLHLEAFISNEWLARLNAVTQEFVEMSRGVKPGAPAGFPDKEARTEQFFVLEESHTPEEPRLTRLTSPVDVHPTYWEFTNGPAADIAADLLGAPCHLHAATGFAVPPGHQRAADCGAALWSRAQPEVPPQQAELQVARRRRRGQVAPGAPSFSFPRLLPFPAD